MDNDQIARLRSRFSNARAGDVYYAVDATRVSGQTPIDEVRVSSVGNKYVYFGKLLSAYKDSDSNKIDHKTLPNYTINRNHRVFATRDDAQAFLESELESSRSKKEFFDNNSEFRRLSEGRIGWSTGKWANVLASMAESEVSHV